MALISVCKKSRASIRALGRQLHQQENLFPCLFRRQYQLFWGNLGVSSPILKRTATAAAARMKARDPTHPTRKTLVFCHLMVEHHSEDTSTSSARCIQYTTLSVFDSCGNSLVRCLCLMHQTCKFVSVSPPAMGLRGRTRNSHK